MIGYVRRVSTLSNPQKAHFTIFPRAVDTSSHNVAYLHPLFDYSLLAVSAQSRTSLDRKQ